MEQFKIHPWELADYTPAEYAAIGEYMDRQDNARGGAPKEDFGKPPPGWEDLPYSEE